MHQYIDGKKEGFYESLASLPGTSHDFFWHLQ
jgi:hypothetical protein